jgi:signal peptidase I
MALVMNYTPTMRKKKGLVARLPWRGLLVLAVGLALVRLFLCTQLRVPTGSMEPTIHGDPAHGDEILVFKPWYHVFSPDHGDLVVFQRSGDDVRSDETVAVKRVAAVGGEAIRIEDGDLWITPPGGTEKRVVKAYHEFRGQLVPLCAERFNATAESRFSANSAKVDFRRGSMTFGTSPEETDDVSVELSTRAVRFDDGWLDEHGVVHTGKDPIRDVLFDLEVELLDSELVLTFEFGIGGDTLRFMVVPLAPGHQLQFTRETVVSGAQYQSGVRMRQISTGRKHRLEFWQIDGNVGFAVDGGLEFEEPLPGGTRVMRVGSEVRDVSLSVRHGRLRATRWDVLRDLHYTVSSDMQHGVDEAYEVPNGEIFVLGDRSSESVDSRHYGSIRVSDLLGAPLMVVAPLQRLRWLR